MRELHQKIIQPCIMQPWMNYYYPENMILAGRNMKIITLHSVAAHIYTSLNLSVKQNRFHNEFPMLCSGNATHNSGKEQVWGEKLWKDCELKLDYKGFFIYPNIVLFI